MTAVPFDTLKLAGRLEDGGAELATKNYIIQLEQRVTIRVGGMLLESR